MRTAIVVLGLAVLAAVGAKPAQAQYVVVVNAQSSVASMSAADLSKVFQKKARNLPDGTEAVPVDLDKNSAVREAFSQAVHGRGVAQIEAYWQQQIFAGRDVPPDVKATDAEVIAFVGATPGGIGYVSASAALGSAVKQVTVQ
jgi:ABC-type phosphate transport system substrate-binding protein